MFNFKKIIGVLALTVALSQVMTAVPVYAAEPEGDKTSTITCKHEGCNNPVESELAPCDECKSSFYNEDCYESKNNEVHSFSIRCVCGDEFVGEEPHWEGYNNGVCICGYEPESTERITCKHEGCNNPVESELAPCDECKSSFYDEDCYESKNDEVHSFSIRCVCGDEFVGEEPHWEGYNNGVCICGYEPESTERITCKHEGCDNPAESDNAPCDECKSSFYNEDCYESKDNEVHSFSIRCVCGDEFVGEEPHWEGYNNGVCICGYELIVSGGDSTNEKTDIVVEEPTYENIAEEIHETIAQAVEEKSKEEEALPVTAFVSTEEVGELPAEVKGEADADTVFNVSQITTTRGFVAAVDKIAKSNTEEKNVTFYSSNPFAFNVDSLAALFNTNKEFVYMFNHNGHLYKITIPAGTKIDLEGELFAGPLFIGAKLGTAVLVK